MISISSLAQKYPGGSVLHFEDWSVEKGDRWLMLGSSGSGKTTLLHILSGLLRPWRGLVEVEGQKLYRLPRKELDLFRGRKVGIVFQRPHLIGSLTILENIVLAQSFADLRENKEQAVAALDSLSIADKQHMYPHQLSEGQLQRASIARAVVNKPGLIIADEPTSSLDDKNARTVLEILMEQADQTGATLIVATHDNRIIEFFSNKYVLSS